MLRTLRVGERAAAGLEYAAVIVVGALVVAAIYASGIPGSVGDRVCEAITQMGFDCAPVGGDEPEEV